MRALRLRRLLTVATIQLAGCVHGPTATDTLMAALGAYDTSVSIEITYETAGRPDPNVTADMESLRGKAWTALQAAQTESRKNSKPDLFGASAAVGAFTAYETAHGLK